MDNIINDIRDLKLDLVLGNDNKYFKYLDYFENLFNNDLKLEEQLIEKKLIFIYNFYKNDIGKNCNIIFYNIPLLDKIMLNEFGSNVNMKNIITIVFNTLIDTNRLSYVIPSENITTLYGLTNRQCRKLFNQYKNLIGFYDNN